MSQLNLYQHVFQLMTN